MDKDDWITLSQWLLGAAFFFWILVDANADERIFVIIIGTLVVLLAMKGNK